jgi:hypothetical protein
MLDPDCDRRLQRYEAGVRAALEELMRGNDYARVEQTLRSLLHGERARPDTKASTVTIIGAPSDQGSAGVRRL